MKKYQNTTTGEESLKAPFIFIFDVEFLLKKLQSCQNNPEKSHTEKKPKHEPSGWAMFTKCLFNNEKNRVDYYREIDCIEKGCKKFKDHAMEITNYEEHEMLPLTDEEIKFYEEQKDCHLCQRVLL